MDSAHGRLSTWSKRVQLVVDFGTYVGELEQQVGNSRAPMHVLIVTSGRKIHRSLKLLLRRSPYRQSTDTVPPCDGLDVMLAAMEVLELHLDTPPPELEPWAWKNWVQWHALAVLLAELLMRSSDPFADQAFGVASNAYRYFARIVADSHSGMLWKPIARLIRRVQDARQISSCHIRDIVDLDLGMVSDYTITEAPIADSLRFFEPFAKSHYKEAADEVEDEVNTFETEPDQQSWLAWDEILEDIIDTSTWG